jgi:hypothetical protein
MADGSKTAILKAIYAILAADTALQALLGGSMKARNIKADPDEEKKGPYLLYDFSPSVSGEEDGMQEAAFLIDIIHKGETTEPAYAIKDRLIALLHRRAITTANNEATAVRVFYDEDEDIAEDQEHLWHVSTKWTVRYFPAAETSAMLGR